MTWRTNLNETNYAICFSPYNFIYSYFGRRRFINKILGKKNTHLRILNEKNTFLKIFLIGCILEKNIQLWRIKFC